MKQTLFCFCLFAFSQAFAQSTGSITPTINYAPSGVVTTVAGNGVLGFSGDGANAKSAELYYPWAVSADYRGNVYFADTYNDRIRKIDTSGNISTVAGDGIFGYATDGIAATSSSLYFPWGVAADNKGNIYISDFYNCRIRKVDTNGIITTVAGNGTYGFSGDGGPATSATISYAYGLCVDKWGNIYIADSYNQRIRKVDTSGYIWTVAGSDSAGFSGDGLPATNARMKYPSGVAADTFGNIFIADWDNSRIRKVDAYGIITTYAGDSIVGFGGDGGPATAANLYYTFGVGTDQTGNVYIADEYNARIRKVNASGIISSIAGIGTWGFSGDNGPATDAAVYYLTGVSADNIGNVYFTDTYNQRIRKINAFVTSICAGLSTTFSASAAGGIWSSSNTAIATVDSVSGAVTGVGAGGAVISYTLSGATAVLPITIYPQPSAGVITGVSTICPGSSATFTDTVTGGIWSSSSACATVSGGVVTGVVQGATYISYSVTNSCGTAATSAQLIVGKNPGVISGSPYVRIGANANFTETVAGGVWSSSSTATVTVNSAGVVHGVAAGTATISYKVTGSCGATYAATYRVIVPPVYAYYVANAISTVAGSGVNGYSGDGGYAYTAKLSYPYTVACDAFGNIYIADPYNQRVRKVSQTGIITTLAGTGVAGFSGDGGPASAAQLYYPFGVAMDIDGNVLIADSYNCRVRKVNVSTGVITTVAGNGSYLYTGDGIQATSCGIYYPSSIATDRFGNIYIDAYYACSIKKVNAAGIISSFAGTGAPGFAGDGLPATNAELYYPWDITTDSNGNVYIADDYNQRVREVNNSGVISTIAGNGEYGFSGDMGPATAASLYYPFGVAFDNSGSLYISDEYDLRVRKVYAGDTINTYAGDGWGTYSGDKVPATASRITDPLGITFDRYNNLYVCDYGTYRVRMVGNQYFNIPVIGGPNAVCVGKTITLTDSLSGGTWSSSNSLKASIDSVYGIVTGLDTGHVTITYSYGGGYRTLSFTISNVYPAAITGYFQPCAYNNTTLYDSTTGGTWSSSTPSIASTGTTGGVSCYGAGTATITYTKTGCYVTQVITVNPNPLSANTGPNAVCYDSSIVLTNSTAGGVWTSGSPTRATIDSTGTVTAISVGTTVITYKIASGCYVTTNMSVGAPITTAITGIASVCKNNVTTLADSTTGGTWSSGTPTVATINSVGALTGVSVGNATITYTKTGCYITAPVTVNPNPLTTSTGPNAVCLSAIITLSNSTSGGSWSSNHTSIATVDSAGDVSGIAAGSATITYKLSSGCYINSNINVGSPITTAITGTPYICKSNTTTLADSTTGGIWTSSATGIATVGGTGIVTGVNAGSAVITYTKYGCFKTQTVTVNPNPVGLITGPNAVCLGNTISLNDTTSGGTWAISPSALATISSGALTGIAVGSTIATYSVASNGCYRTANITVNGTNPASISGTANVCTGNITTLSDSTTGGSWTSGTTSIATVSGTGAVTGVSSGTANITYTKTGCYVVQPVTVNANPLAANVGPNAVCAGNTITLTNSTTGGIWASSNGSIASIDGSGDVTGVAGGSAVITYSLSSGCYKTSNIAVGSVNPATIGGTANVCTGNITTLTDATTGGAWTSGTPTVATVSGIGAVTGVSSGTANITYTKTGCYAVQQVTVNTNPLANNTGPNAVCQGNTITISNTTSGGSWMSNNPGVGSVDSFGDVTGIAPGSAVITYMLGSGCYRNSSVTVSNTYPASIGGVTSVCAGNVATLTDATTGGTWSSSNTSIASINSSTGVIIGGATTGTATITYNKTGCYVTESFTNNTNTVYNISGPNAVCTGNTITLYDSTYYANWSSSNTSVATVGMLAGNSADVAGVSAGSAVITYTGVSTGCYKTFNVTVSATYPGTISGVTSLCAGNAATLTDATTGGTWTSGTPAVAYISGTGIMSGITAGTANITYTKTGCYVVQSVTVNSNPVANITGSIYGCVGTNTTLSDASGGGSWSIYNTNATLSSTGVYTGVSAGSDIVTYSGAAGCYKTATIYIARPPAAITGTASICNSRPDTLTETVAGGVWSSSATTKATVSSSGVVTGIAAGTANISYTVTGCPAAVFPVTVSICRFANEDDPAQNLDETTTISYNLLPNPNNGIMQIAQSQPDNVGAVIEVMDEAGRTIYSEHIAFVQGYCTLMIKDIDAGIYLMRLIDDKGRKSVFRLVIAK